MFRSGAERKRLRLEETEIQESTEMAFEVYGKQLKTVPSFNYLGRILMAGDDDWIAVAGNLGKARKSWGRLRRILSREGADKRVLVIFYDGGPTGTAVWKETWMVTPRIERALNSFMHGAARRITGK